MLKIVNSWIPNKEKIKAKDIYGLMIWQSQFIEKKILAGSPY